MLERDNKNLKTLYFLAKSSESFEDFVSQTEKYGGLKKFKGPGDDDENLKV